MSHPSRPSDQPWAAADYDGGFAFVPRYGLEVVALLNPQPGESIIDLGCGTGTLTAAIAAAGAQVVGVDADRNMLERARQQYPQIPFRHADAHAFTVEAPVDAVFSNAALHWMTRPADVIARVAAALKPGGRFVAEMGGRGNCLAIHDAVAAAIEEESVPRSQIANPWYFPTLGEYARLLEQGGFAVRYARYFDRPTALEYGEEGLAHWIRMFTPTQLRSVPAERVAAVITRVEERLRPTLFRHGVWLADYRRLRFVAVKE